MLLFVCMSSAMKRTLLGIVSSANDSSCYFERSNVLLSAVCPLPIIAGLFGSMLIFMPSSYNHLKLIMMMTVSDLSHSQKTDSFDDGEEGRVVLAMC